MYTCVLHVHTRVCYIYTRICISHVYSILKKHFNILSLLGVIFIQMQEKFISTPSSLNNQALTKRKTAWNVVGPMLHLPNPVKRCIKLSLRSEKG